MQETARPKSAAPGRVNISTGYQSYLPTSLSAIPNAQSDTACGGSGSSHSLRTVPGMLPASPETDSVFAHRDSRVTASYAVLRFTILGPRFALPVRLHASCPSVEPSFRSGHRDRFYQSQSLCTGINARDFEDASCVFGRSLQVCPFDGLRVTPFVPIFTVRVKKLAYSMLLTSRARDRTGTLEVNSISCLPPVRWPHGSARRVVYEGDNSQDHRNG
jgi:hypothetical protein